MILMILDATKRAEQRALLETELEMGGIRLNKEPPWVFASFVAVTCTNSNTATSTSRLRKQAAWRSHFRILPKRLTRNCCTTSSAITRFWTVKFLYETKIVSAMNHHSEDTLTFPSHGRWLYWRNHEGPPYIYQVVSFLVSCVLRITSWQKPSLYVYNKVDSIGLEHLDSLAREPNTAVMSCELDLGVRDVVDRCWEELRLIRIYTKRCVHK